MNSSNPAQWLYWKLFLNNPNDRQSWKRVPREIEDSCLLNVIYPLVADWQQMSENYFFIRYGEGGHHLRLRVCLPRDAHAEADARLEEAASKFFPELDPQSLPGTVDPQHLRETGWLQTCPYQPETAKYGGEAGIQIAENHFTRSSNVAFNVLQLTRMTTLKLSSIALELLVTGFERISPEAATRAFLAKMYCNFWMGLLKQPDDTSIEQQLESNYQQRASHLNPYLYDERENRLENRLPDSASQLFAIWRETLTISLATVAEKEQQGAITSPLHNFADSLADTSFAQFPAIQEAPFTRVITLFNYIHMLNNRLGLTTLQEVQLSHLYWRHLQATHNLELPVAPRIYLEPEAISAG